MEFPLNCENVSERMNGETKIELRIRFEACWIAFNVTIVPGPFVCSRCELRFCP
jgi:hypothetical protein